MLQSSSGDFDVGCRSWWIHGNPFLELQPSLSFCKCCGSQFILRILPRGLYLRICLKTPVILHHLGRGFVGEHIESLSQVLILGNLPQGNVQLGYPSRGSAAARRTGKGIDVMLLQALVLFLFALWNTPVNEHAYTHTSTHTCTHTELFCSLFSRKTRVTCTSSHLPLALLHLLTFGHISLYFLTIKNYK